MITGLFSSFDFFFLSFSPVLAYFLFWGLFSGSFNLISGRQFFLTDPYSILSKFFYSLNYLKFDKFSMYTFFSIFTFLFAINFLSVLPYNFSLTAQISTILPLALGFWAAYFLFSLLINLSGVICHGIPEGSPLGLSLALFAIELVSSIIRPVTLTVRLGANILAGHLLMALLAALLAKLPAFLGIYVGLVLVESFVALIQAYIFCTLLCLFFAEI